MKVDLNCNVSRPRYNQNFGMAFRIKGMKFQEHVDKIPQETQTLIDYAGMIKSKAARKGYLQMSRELAPNTHYDAVFNPQDRSMEVVEVASGKVVESFCESPDGVTGLNHLGVFTYPGRKILAYFFNPKLFLPYNMNLATERTLQLEKEAVNKAKVCENLNHEDLLGL